MKLWLSLLFAFCLAFLAYSWMPTYADELQLTASRVHDKVYLNVVTERGWTFKPLLVMPKDGNKDGVMSGFIGGDICGTEHLLLTGIPATCDTLIIGYQYCGQNTCVRVNRLVSITYTHDPITGL